ncbi:MFS transporter [Planotetraspora silvatica]|uniref:MFS transporter n=1 Tax=Planotetraspora silvatica TaxID=234614 RepID=A0A8J3UPJ7_9ACTN|nr:MFS transporter [Planotetraspora silvatica]GII48206.1 MFS transporter [Planotetraspora silvatica]
MARTRRLAALAHHDLRLFFIGESASLLGSSMATVAVTFAVLDGGGTGADLGYVMAARIVPMVVLMLVGGAVADRFGPRRVMVASDVLRCAVQAVLAVLLLTGRPAVWTFVALLAMWGAGESFYAPARGALIPEIAAGGEPYEGKLRDANALAGMAGSLASVAGPALAGIAVAAAGSGAVVAVDALTYVVSAVALLALRVQDRPSRPAGRGGGAALLEGWAQFRSRTWLWVTTLQFTLFNLLVWAPFLVLGPVVAHERLGGARDWGLIMAFYGSGAVVGGLASLGGRTPRRPLVVATIATAGWALPSGAIAAGLPVMPVAGAAFGAGIGSAVCGMLYATTNQRHMPAEVMARITSLTTVGAFALGPLGLAAAGPVATLAGTAAVLGFGAIWQITTGLAVLAVPDVRRLG